MRIGLISDTHGLLRPEVLDFLRGSDHIVHGGDVCDAGVLEKLRAIVAEYKQRFQQEAVLRVRSRACMSL